MKTILLTGAAGTIGRSLHGMLSDRYRFRSFDRVAVNHLNNELNNDWNHAIVGDITNWENVLEAMQGVDAVIHLAANPEVEQPWQDVYTIGIQGTYHVFEAARRAGVRKILYASSNHVSGGWELEGVIPIAPDMPLRPDSLYGVGKVFGEALGRFYCDRYGISVICLRIGTFVTEPAPANSDARVLKTWCSPRDFAQLVTKSLETEGLGFQIFYAVSANPRRFWDIDNATLLVGYQPQDNAELYLKGG